MADALLLFFLDAAKTPVPQVSLRGLTRLVFQQIITPALTNLVTRISAAVGLENAWRILKANPLQDISVYSIHHLRICMDAEYLPLDSMNFNVGSEVWVWAR